MSGFIPFPMKRHQRFYRTAAPSLSAPYAVPPSLASLTCEKSSDNKRRPILLPYLVLTGLESALAGIGEAISWLDGWLSTVSRFREALYPSAQANFERILSSGSKALAFVGSQAVQPWLSYSSPAGIHSWWKYGLQYRQKNCLFCSTPLCQLLRRSSPPTLLDTALNKARAASNDALVHKALHPPRISEMTSTGHSRASSANRSADTSGSSPLTPQSIADAS